MESLIKNIMIALLVIGATVMVIFMILFLHPSLGNKERQLKVRFNNIEKVTVGTRVNFAGKPLGEVESIQLLKDVISQKISHNGTIYPYELTLIIDSNINIFNIDEISVISSGLIGEKYIEIIPALPKEGETFAPVKDQVLYATRSESLEGSLKDSLHELRSVVQDIQKNKIVAKAGDSLGHIRDMTKALDDPKALTETLNNLHSLSDRAKNSWDSIDKSLNHFTKITANGDRIFSKIARGEGTVGRLVVGDELYLKFNALLNKGDIIFNDINHYGLLFHLDKGWQRLRARRLNLMQTLRSPQEFRNYFNDEIDQISTSLSRVAMVLEMTEQDICCYELLSNREYAKVFAELMRRVSTLDAEIKSYNIQVYEEGSVPITEFVTPCR